MRSCREFNIMNGPIFAEQSPSKQSNFWSDATKYTSTSNDECFVEEIAYMMVTLHRTGA